MKKLLINTLGCKVNTYDSEIIISSFKNNGYKLAEVNDIPDVIVINTCTVTNTSDSKSRKLISKYRRKYPESIIVVTGCMPQVINEDELIIDADVITGTGHRHEIYNLVNEYKYKKKKIIKIDSSRNINVENNENIKMSTRTRAFIKIQDGCNQYCTYCIIPYARGSIRSKPINDVINEINRYAQNGHKEINLTGIHLTSYGVDLENVTLVDLLKEIEKIKGIHIIRLGSIEQSIITDEFLNYYKNSKKLAHHFHLSFQSGSDKILKLMNRKYTIDEFYNKVNMLRDINPHVSITTDIIVGFPSETENDFKDTCNTIKKIKFSSVHFFRYSRKKGTKAALMENQVSENIKKERLSYLENIQNNITTEYNNSMIGKEVIYIVEKQNNNITSGSTNYYFKAYNKDEFLNKNDVKRLKIKEIINKKIWLH